VEMEGEGRHGQNSQTLVDPCQLPTWLVETRMEKRAICGICLKVAYAALTAAYAASKWHTPLRGAQP
jgi:hypothetical protein